MRKLHIAFILEQAYGHIVPTLGIAIELLRRGHRVSYAVNPSFAPAIPRIGADAMVYESVEIRAELCERARREDGTYDFDPSSIRFMEFFAQLRSKKTVDALSQLEKLYRQDEPDLVIHDDCLDVAGREFARRRDIPKIRHVPALIEPHLIDSYAQDRCVLVSIPAFFHEKRELFDDRFHFIGIIPEGREQFFSPWEHHNDMDGAILFSSTTGLLPQIEFCRLAIQAFGDQPWPVVLSIAGQLDPVSEVDPAWLEDLPTHFFLNRFASNLDILKHCRLFVGQGGQGSVLEALYSGVPILSIPPTLYHDAIARRVVELGLGARLPVSEASAESLRRLAASLLCDQTLIERVSAAQRRMHEDGGARRAADLIEEFAS